MLTMTAIYMTRALAALDRRLDRSVTLVVGGGGAMVLAYMFPLATSDIDAVAKGISNDELTPYIRAVALEMDLPADWLNPWFGSFTYVLSADYDSRLVEVFSGSKLQALALGKEDLLLMKCFAHRQKDIAHARALLRAGADTDFVYNRIQELDRSQIPGTEKALEFLETIIDLEEP